MTTTLDDGLQVKGLRRRDLDALAARARRWGMTPEKYVKYLVEEDLAISQEARTTPFAALMGHGKSVDEAAVDVLVERAKTRHFQKHGKSKR